MDTQNPAAKATVPACESAVAFFLTVLRQGWYDAANAEKNVTVAAFSHATHHRRSR